MLKVELTLLDAEGPLRDGALLSCISERESRERYLS